MKSDFIEISVQKLPETASGIVVHLHEQDGQFSDQITIIYPTNTPRDKTLHVTMYEVITKALTQFFADREDQK